MFFFTYFLIKFNMKRIKEFLNNQELKITYFNNQVHVLNYKDILLLDEDKIILKKESGTITIKGSNLTLLKLLDEEILIQGQIKSIEM